MRKKEILYLIPAVLVIAGIFLLQYSKPKQVNWFPTYSASHKSPYGTYVLNAVLEKLFATNQQVSEPPIEFLSSDNAANGTYIFVNQTITFNEAELHKLLEWTAKGNTLFIASQRFEKSLLDTLGLKETSSYLGFKDGHQEPNQYRLTHRDLQPQDRFGFDRNSHMYFFDAIDTLNTQVISAVQNNSLDNKTEQVASIRQDFGDGRILLTSFPEAFTNYFLLQDQNKNYTAGLLSYIDDTKPVYVDAFYKNGKTVYSSPMRLFLNTKELKWAYYMLLIGAVVYIIFEGKRKQRAIPVVEPLKNQTLDFTRTVSDMYYEQGDRKAIVEHKINYFMDWLRSRYYMGITQEETTFYNHLASRSGNTVAFVTKVFNFMEQLRDSPQITDNDVLTLNNLLQTFKANANGS